MLEKTYQFVKQITEKESSGHGVDHIERVYHNAEKILSYEKEADAFVVLMAALLHDVDDYKINPDGQRANNFLHTLNLPENKIQQILTTIDAIGFSKSGANPKFDTLEQMVLSDADKLDAIGAIGICRTIAYNTAKHRPLFKPDFFPDENQTLEQYKQAQDPCINHFFDKLLKLKNTMQTQTAKKMAQERHDFLVAFLREFFTEMGTPQWSEYLDGWLTRHI